MVTKIANQRVYHNFAIGTAKHPHDDKSMYLVFTDKDNEVVHMFEIGLDEVDGYVSMVTGAKHTHNLHIAGANEMPK
jgi:hypothetical protein